MFMGDWLIISPVISFMACIKLEWKSLIREIEHIHLLSQQTFLELRYISLSLQRYDCTVYLSLGKYFRNRLYLKNNSVSPFVLSSSIPMCIWPFSIAIISYDSVPYAWKGITQKMMFLPELWCYHIACLSLSFLNHASANAFKTMTAERIICQNLEERYAVTLYRMS